jgi:hypothetical protein
MAAPLKQTISPAESDLSSSHLVDHSAVPSRENQQYLSAPVGVGGPLLLGLGAISKMITTAVHVWFRLPWKKPGS